MSIVERARPEIRAMTAYSSARSAAGRAPVLLNANEKPWGPPAGFEPGVELNRYPDPQPAGLRRLMAEHYRVPEAQLLITRGSDEAIDLLVRAFCEAGRDSIVQCPPCFGMYAIAARIQGAAIVDIPLRAENDFAPDIEAIIESVDNAVKLVFLTSPNNPTGGGIEPDLVLELADAIGDRALVVLDEAYIEFCDRPSLAAAVSERDNLAVLRTLSKAYGLAGARCGALIADPAVIELLKRIISPYPLPSPSILAAEKALAGTDSAEIKRQCLQIMQNKSPLVRLLRAQDWVRRIWPGEANFVLAEVDQADRLCRFLAGQGVLVRNFSHHPMLPDCVRITVGSDADQQRLGDALAGYDPHSDDPSGDDPGGDDPGSDHPGNNHPGNTHVKAATP